MESILTSVKKMLGIAEEYEHFDPDIIMHINTVFSILTQLGAGTWFSISDKTAVWSDFIGDRSCMELIKSYMYLKVRLLFDPPVSSAVSEAVSRQIAELEWRINVTVDPSENGFGCPCEETFIDDETVSKDTTYSSEKVEEKFIDIKELDELLVDCVGIIYSKDAPPKGTKSDTWYAPEIPAAETKLNICAVSDEISAVPSANTKSVRASNGSSVIDDSAASGKNVYSSAKIEEKFVDAKELNQAIVDRSGVIYSPDIPPKNVKSRTWFELEASPDGMAYRKASAVSQTKATSSPGTTQKSVIDDTAASKDTTYSSEKIEADFIDNDELGKALDTYSGIKYSESAPKRTNAMSWFKIEPKKGD